MTWWSRAAIAALAVAVLVGQAAAVGGAAGTTIRPARMVLQLGDVPTGFVVSRADTGVRTNARLIRERGATEARKIRRWGRITGYRAMYTQRNPRTGSLPGVYAFVGHVGVYRTTTGAHAASVDRTTGCASRGWRAVPRVAGSNVGADTRVCTLLRESARVFAVQWRNGRVTAAAQVIAVDGAVTAWTAVIAARKQNARIRAELLAAR